MRPARWLIVATALAAASLILTGVAVVSAGFDTETGTGGTVTRVKTASGTGDETTSGGWQTIAGARRSIDVAGDGALLVARFNATDECTGTPGDFACMVRIVVDEGATKLVMEPSPVKFDFVGDDVSESHATERYIEVGPGQYTVKAQFRVQGEDTTFHVCCYALVVERADR